MDLLVIMNTIFTVCTYAVVLFFLVSIVRAFLRTKNVQDAIVYSIILIPFVLRILRLK